MLRWLRRLFRPADPAAEFLARRGELLAEWFRVASTSGKPKWLTWVGYEEIADPLFVRGLALAYLLVRYEPVADAPLEHVPQAREPRPVVAVFTFRHGRWATDGRAVFNLTPQQVAERLNARAGPP